jgi:hypothetical protein
MPRLVRGVLFVAALTAATGCSSSPSQPSASTTTAVVPAVALVSPSAGDPGGGTTVTITGSGFTNATAVKFGTLLATLFTVSSDTSIVALSPAGPVGTSVDVTVSTAAGTSATNSADQFTWGQNALTALTLSATSVTGGTPVIGTITLAYSAPAAGITLPLTWTSTPPLSTSVIMPRSVTVAAGSSTASFQVTTFYVSSKQQIVITSQYNGVQSASLSLEP